MIMLHSSADVLDQGRSHSFSRRAAYTMFKSKLPSYYKTAKQKVLYAIYPRYLSDW